MEYREAEYQRYQERLSEMDRQVPVKKCADCQKEIPANDSVCLDCRNYEEAYNIGQNMSEIEMNSLQGVYVDIIPKHPDFQRLFTEWLSEKIKANYDVARVFSEIYLKPERKRKSK
jgi:predicted amidophosphoribosyltransferase